MQDTSNAVDDVTIVDAPMEWTFLFSDIEGSTPLWERNQRLMSAALVLHDELVGDAVAAHGGDLFKHTGDGVIAAFESPAAALDAAIAMQQAIVGGRWPPDFHLRIRAGLHHGPAQRRSDDYFGRTLNVAARIMSAAQGTQLLVSDVVVDALGSDHGHILHDQGSCSLKGITDPVRIHSVEIDGIEHKFAPLAEAAREVAPVTSLPLVPNDLVGRTAELESIAKVMSEHRIVTLTGAPGTGKTRLAIEVAGLAAPVHTSGTHMVELAPLTDGTAVPDVVASVVLGIDPVADAGTGAARLAAGVTGPTLIVLDNCEHLIDDVAEYVRRMAQANRDVRFLLTSREPLLVAGEHVVSIEPLDDSSGGPASQLFLQRARLAHPDLTDLDVDVVTDICSRLDGLPLAIELAAARLDVLSLEELSDRLHEILGSGRRSRRRQADRHATVEAAVRWSWDLLDDDERLVLSRASVFVGSFDLEAAIAVCGADDIDHVEIIDLIGLLQDRSFISPVWSEAGNRFRLLEIVRTFSASQLSDDDTVHARTRHQEHYSLVASQLAQVFDEKPDADVIALLELDDPNFGAALHHNDESSIRSARKLAISLHTYWEETGRLVDGLAHLRRLSEPPDPRSALWFGVLGLSVSYGAILGRLDEVREAEVVLQELATGEPNIRMVNIYFAFGFASLGRGELTEAAEWFGIAADVIAPVDGGTHRQALMTAGACLAYAGDPDAALTQYELARNVLPPEQGWFQDYLAVFEMSARVQQDPAGADDAWFHVIDSALDALLDKGLGFRVTVAAHQAALAFALVEHRELFAKWAPVALQMAHRNGHRWAVGLGLVLMAWDAAWTGDRLAAVRHWAMAERVFADASYGMPPTHSEISAALTSEIEPHLDERQVARIRDRVGQADLATYLDEL